MRKLSILWGFHLLATVVGWYSLSAFAQGVVDSTADATLPLIIFNAIIVVLSFPVVLYAAQASSGFGGFSLPSLFWFCAVAAVNSALFVAAFAGIRQAVKHLRRNGK